MKTNAVRVSVLGARKAYPVYVDESVSRYERIAVSAGVRGTQIVLAPADYRPATRARTAPIAHVS
ncbi:MAG: YbaK/EbsC family protein [Myxococcota bacterium]